MGAARQGRCVATSVEDAGRLAWAFGLPMHPALDDRRSKARRRLTATAVVGASREDLVSVASSATGWAKARAWPSEEDANFVKPAERAWRPAGRAGGRGSRTKAFDSVTAPARRWPELGRSETGPMRCYFGRRRWPASVGLRATYASSARRSEEQSAAAANGDRGLRGKPRSLPRCVARLPAGPGRGPGLARRTQT